MKKQRFWCDAWEQWVYEEVCMHRYKKGLKKCAECEKGKALLEAKIAGLKEEHKAYGLHNDGN